MFEGTTLRLSFSVIEQHVPRINGEIPSVDEAASDHGRLLDRYLLKKLYFEEIVLGSVQ